jgi:hypothetical protein
MDRLLHVSTLLGLLMLLVLESVGAQTGPIQQGPFRRLVIRSAVIVDGTGGPPYGPADVVIENNRITEIRVVGHPLAPIQPGGRPARGDYEIDAQGMYLLPGLIDSHVHALGPSSKRSGLGPEYYAYLNLSHGVTSIVDVVGSEPLAWNVEFAKKVTNNEVISPRYFAFARLSVDGVPQQFDFGIVNTPERGREWVRAVAKAGAVGLKLRGSPPKITGAILAEAKTLGLKTTMHLEQRGIGQMNIVDAAKMGLGRQDHWYGLAEAMLKDNSIPFWRTDYVYINEQDRWRDAGLTWHQAVEPGSPEWNKVMDVLLALDFTIAPTQSFYDYLRDTMARRNADWNDEFSSPGMMASWQLQIGNHPGILDWKTEDEVNWRHFFTKWHQFLKEYNRRGGRIVAGSDAGSGYGLYGFGLIREMELLQEAGLNSTEVVRSATLYAAQYLGVDDDLGTVQVGKLADLLLVDENPLENFKVLYGTGHLRFNAKSNRLERIGGVKTTIRGGVIYDAVQMRTEVKKMVRAVKAKK